MKILVAAVLVSGVSFTAVAGLLADELDTNARVRLALRTDLGSAARVIRIDSHGGTVRLAGAVDSRAMIDRALLSASAVDGVNHVMDSMVSPALPGTGSVD